MRNACPRSIRASHPSPAGHHLAPDRLRRVQRALDQPRRHRLDLMRNTARCSRRKHGAASGLDTTALDRPWRRRRHSPTSELHTTRRVDSAKDRAGVPPRSGPPARSSPRADRRGSPRAKMIRHEGELAFVPRHHFAEENRRSGRGHSAPRPHLPSSTRKLSRALRCISLRASP